MTTATTTSTSADGTTIALRTLGKGPALVVAHGAMESADSHLDLAEELADSHTVTLYDRRGRGGSGPHRPDHGGATEVADLAAVLAATGARAVLGVSSGALVLLNAALTLDITHAIVFEPPLSVAGSADTSWLPRYDKEIADGDAASAMVTAMLGAGMGPAFLRRLPRRLLRSMTAGMMSAQERKAAPGAVTMRALAPTMHYDGRLVSTLADSAPSYAAITAHVLLLGGTKSPGYLRTGLDALAEAIPHATRVELPGLGHSATGNRDQQGKPAVVAPVVKSFLAG